MTHQFLFAIFASIAVLGAAWVVVARNPVRAVLCLVLTFVATAATWLMLEAEFLAILLILVYVGAVMVLFLFVVMMLDINYAELREGFTRYLPVGVCVSVLLFILIFNAIGPSVFPVEELARAPLHEPHESPIHTLGLLLFQDYVLHVEIAGLLLLVAMISAIALTFRGPQSRKTQNINKQVSVRAKDRLKLIKMQSEKQPFEGNTP